MPEFFVATVEDENGATAAVVEDGQVYVVPDRPSVHELLANWDASLDRLEQGLRQGTLRDPSPVDATRFLPPLPAPRNLYMAGANYADHAREMRGLPPGAPVEKPPEGPFFFLKPTTTLVGHREPVRLPAGYERVDWEVELAAVICRRAHQVSAEAALAHVAGYTIVNDVSVRDAFKRGEGAEPPLTWDWFLQKGWHTSCPCGPWILPSRFCPDPGDLAISLTLNGAVEQASRTSELIFSVEELVAFASGVVPLVCGDIVSTGTPSGVGAGKGRFLAAGDVMVAEVERIGALENPVAAGTAGSTAPSTPG